MLPLERLIHDGDDLLSNYWQQLEDIMKAFPDSYLAANFENKWRSTWKERGIYRWNPKTERSRTFVVDSPPPTVSGSLHVGHVFSYTQQDLIVRHRRMKGLNICYPMGWDDNGLPTERRVQNLHNVRCDPYSPYDPHFVRPASKKGNPVLVSRRNFIELCGEVTRSDEEAFRSLWQHLGLSIDWSLEYATIDGLCRRTSQQSFLELHRAGHVYQVDAPTLWDVDFQTAVAQAEVEDKVLPGAFHHLQFGVEGGGSLVIATTRPELLAACIAVVAHPSDVRYQSLFGREAITPLFRVRVPILADERANPEKGTGILMVCTFGDSTDVEWWRQFGLPLRQTIGRDGRMLEVTFGSAGWESIDSESATTFYAEIKGKSVKQARSTIVDLLRREAGEALAGLGVPLQGEPRPIEHALKLYEKGDRPLEIVTSRQWFVRLLDKKEALLGQGDKIAWHPPHMKSRYQNWVEGLNQDWCISRQRYFGVPFPVWYEINAEGHICYDRPILPSREQLPIDPMAEPAPGYLEVQRGQPGGFVGDPDVMDTWATSSLTPQIVSQWANNSDRHARLFPMDIRPQSHEIIRTWAFYTIVRAYLHENQIPWKHVLISGWILDPDRKKMSKSQGNVVTPDHLLDQYSADAVRYWTARARLGVDTAYDESLFGNGKRLAMKLFNASKFVHGIIKNADPDTLDSSHILCELDRGIVEKLARVASQADQCFEAFDYAGALSEMETFFWSDFCDNYLELVKARAYSDTESPERQSAWATLHLLLSVQLRLFAPVLPYICEELWDVMYATSEGQLASIHTSPWPEVVSVKPVTHDPYGAAADVLKEVRRVKGEQKVSMKAPLATFQVAVSAEDLLALEAVRQDLEPTCGGSMVLEVRSGGTLRLGVVATLSPKPDNSATPSGV